MNAEAMDKLWIVLSAETGREPGDPVELARLELLARCFPQDGMTRAVIRSQTQESSND